MTPRALKKWRLRLEMTQDSFAIWLGVSRSTVNRWEGGLQTIPKMVELVERHYHKSVESGFKEMRPGHLPTLLRLDLADGN